MIILIIIFLFISICSTIGLYYSIKKNLEYFETIERIITQLDESLDALEFCYKRIDKKAKLELFSNDPTIKELVEDIKMARQIVLLISEKLVEENEDFKDKNIIQ